MPDADTLFAEPEPDRFEHESPLRAFSDWNATGNYAIGKGLRPSVQHLPVYLDAIERKEGWQLIQLLTDDHGAFRSAIFRRIRYPLEATEPEDPHVILRDFQDRFPGPFQMWLDSLPPEKTEEEKAVHREIDQKHERAVAMAAEMDGLEETFRVHDQISYSMCQPFEPRSRFAKWVDDLDACDQVKLEPPRDPQEVAPDGHTFVGYHPEDPSIGLFRKDPDVHPGLAI